MHQENNDFECIYFHVGMIRHKCQNVYKYRNIFITYLVENFGK